nr:30S ribosomal protein S17P [uncultured archaeon]
MAKTNTQVKHRNIGVEAKPPGKTCDNDKCPWHGKLGIRGRLFKGRVATAKALNTAIVEWNYYHFSPKYERYERRHSRVAAFNPACIAAAEGEIVVIAECRPLSKSKRFVVIEKITEALK